MCQKKRPTVSVGGRKTGDWELMGGSFSAQRPLAFSLELLVYLERDLVFNPTSEATTLNCDPWIYMVIVLGGNSGGLLSQPSGLT